LVSAVGYFGYNAAEEIVKTFEGGEKSLRIRANAGAEISSYAKRAEGHAMLFMMLKSENDKDKFPARIKSLEQQIDLFRRASNDTAELAIISNIEKNTALLKSAGMVLIETFDSDKKLGLGEYKDQIRKFHELAAQIRKLGVNLAKKVTDVINKQRPITAASEVASYAKRAEGHLILFITLRDEIDKEKFFLRKAGLI